MKSKLQMFKGSRGRRSEVSGDKNYFSRIMDPLGQTLLVDCFCSLTEVSPPMSAHNLSHLKCTVVVKRHAKTTEWGLPGSWEEPSSHPGFAIAQTVLLLTAIVYLS